MTAEVVDQAVLVASRTHGLVVTAHSGMAPDAYPGWPDLVGGSLRGEPGPSAAVFSYFLAPSGRYAALLHQPPQDGPTRESWGHVVLGPAGQLTPRRALSLIGRPGWPDGAVRTVRSLPRLPSAEVEGLFTVDRRHLDAVFSSAWGCRALMAVLTEQLRSADSIVVGECPEHLRLSFLYTVVTAGELFFPDRRRTFSTRAAQGARAADFAIMFADSPARWAEDLPRVALVEPDPTLDRRPVDRAALRGIEAVLDSYVDDLAHGAAGPPRWSSTVRGARRVLEDLLDLHSERPSAPRPPSPPAMEPQRLRPPAAAEPQCPRPPVEPPPVVAAAAREDAPRAYDDIQFSVHRPARVAHAQWYPLLAFVHQTRRFQDRQGRWVDPLGVVTSIAQALLMGQTARYDQVIADSRQALRRGSRLVLEAWLDKGEVEPPRAVVVWTDPVHVVQFKVRVDQDAAGERLAGGLRVFAGMLLIGEVTFQVTATTATTATTTEQAEDTAVDMLTAPRFRRIFASYSHQDSHIVGEVARYASLAGDLYVIDVHTLRSGERWRTRLAELIDGCDVFQLFWSRHAMGSSQVRDEWEHALTLGREGFVRPVYWEEPRPTDSARGLPPAALNQLHWSKLDLSVHSPSAARSPLLGGGTGLLASRTRLDAWKILPCAILAALIVQFVVIAVLIGALDLPIAE